MNWYYAVEGRSKGPLSEGGLERLVHEGVVDAQSLVWHPGLEEWGPLAELKPELVKQGGKGVVAGPPDGGPGLIPLPEPIGKHGAETGFFKRIFGLGRKKPE